MLNNLKKIPLFFSLSDKDLSILQKDIEIMRFNRNRVLFKEGEYGDKAYFIKQGEIEIKKTIEGKEQLLAIRKSGDIIGEMSLLEDTPRSASATVIQDAELIVISKESFNRLLQTNPRITQHMLKTVLKRFQETEVLFRQSEKMAQLGILTAGIAHELNNPASSVQRGSAYLQELTEKHREIIKTLYSIDLNQKQQKIITSLEEKIRGNLTYVTPLSSLEAADKEEEIITYLNNNKIPEADLIASSFISADFSKQDIEELKNNFITAQLPVVLRLIATIVELNQVLKQVNTGASQISQIVKALKSYVYLDQGPVQEVDIHKGIEESLIILSYKLGKGVKVIKDYHSKLPLLTAQGSELNQVWTNLIDNAIDAMNGQGALTIKTGYDEKWIIVKIQDTGKGIPQKIQNKIFTPFFTTKPPGKGTGLGLDISYNIVVYKHKGEISFTSQQGKTVFAVKLPITLKTAGFCKIFNKS